MGRIWVCCIVLTASFVVREARASLDRVSTAGIQSAIDRAADGDVIVVEPGIYSGNISFRGKNVTLRSRCGPEETVLDGAYSAPSVVSFTAGEGRAARLAGFTIRNGVGTAAVPGIGLSAGGAILVRDSSPTIVGNRFVANGVSYLAGSLRGGAIYLGGRSSPVIQGNVFDGNSAYEAGAIHVNGSGSPRIAGNVFRNNDALIGAAVVCGEIGGVDRLDVLLRENEFRDNSDVSFFSRGSVTVLGGSGRVRVVSSFFSGTNSQTGDGRGVGSYQNTCRVTVSGCMFSEHEGVSVEFGCVEVVRSDFVLCDVGVSSDSDCRIVESRFDRCVTAVHSSGRSVEFRNNVVAGCGPCASIVDISSVVNAVVEGNTICENDGAALSLQHGGRTGMSLISGNVFLGNQGPCGGGVKVLDGSAVVENNVIADNAGGSGAGLRCFFSDVVMRNCTIVGNVWSNHSNSGLVLRDANVTVESCILWGNGSPGSSQVDVISGSSPTVSFSDVQGGYPGAGNFAQNALFVDAGGGDYRLTPQSPCIDAGLPTLAGPGVDVAGMPRILDGDLDGGMRVDVGSHEFGNATMALESQEAGAVRLLVTGPHTLDVLLIGGSRGSGVVFEPLGAVFVDLGLPFVVRPLGTMPVSLLLDTSSNVGGLAVQALAFSAQGGLGNLSNSLDLPDR